MAVVDGSDGTIYVDPDEETMALMQEKKRADEEKKALLQQLKGKENKTIDGKKIMLYANIGNIKDLAAVIQNDAAESAFSEVSSYIWRRKIIRLRRSSLRFTRQPLRQWQERM